ncbi:GNAT family N-acetyltransferase [Phenylobacterium sp. LjRoot225]|uniref:MSMEG_0567/Sll0786 family nitrogen starvation N-acetyltransferase n=1 Tax=Phenylobacterium sp. LjRoot225 TaxID=3342285 RepID=UPI003ED037E9
MLEPFRPFVAPTYRVKFATEHWEFDGARDLRRAVFCDEQGVFEVDDADAIDAYALPIVAVDLVAGDPHQVVGAVRIHQSEPSVWWGSRLAVAQGFRRVGALGAGLIKVAVGSAKGLGCQRFYAHVQAQNRPLFERLHWRVLDPVELCGRPHWLMQADLEHYAVIEAPDLGISVRRLAA